MNYLINIYLQASGGSQEVAVASEGHAERLVHVLDPQVVDYVELYRMHVVEEGESPYEFIRLLPLRS